MAFDQYFRMDCADAARYATEVLRLFPTGAAPRCEEIGDGNINYVFRVWDPADGGSVILKQADRLLRSSGRPLDGRRSLLEAEYLRLAGALAPGMVPTLYRYDETMHIIAMEDLTGMTSLRRALMAGRLPPRLADQLAAYLADTLLPTTDLVLDRGEKRRRAAFFTNPELCDITEDLVLTEPYHDYKGRNQITPGNEAFVAETLYGNAALHAQAGMLRDRFLNCGQALLHGDLHTGSLFTDGQDIRVIDAEFACYGPMGYDIGNVLGNLFFAWAYLTVVAQQPDAGADVAAAIAQVYGAVAAKLAERYDALVTCPLYRTEDFRRQYLDQVLSDAVGYAGTEMVRRSVGDAKVPELTESPAPLRAAMERALVRQGVDFILERDRLVSGAALTARFATLLAKELA